MLSSSLMASILPARLQSDGSPCARGSVWCRLLYGSADPRQHRPARHDEGVNLKRRVVEGHREGGRVGDLDTYLLPALAHHRLLRSLAGLDVAADEVGQVQWSGVAVPSFRR